MPGELWLTAVRLIMRWDKAGSEVFVIGSLLGAAGLGLTHGWQSAAWLLVPVIFTGAIWLALLGILIFVGLVVTMRSGVNPDDDFWQNIIAIPGVRGESTPVRKTLAVMGTRWPPPLVRLP